MSTQVILFKEAGGEPQWMRLTRAAFMRELKATIGAECLQAWSVSDELVLYLCEAGGERTLGRNQCLHALTGLEFFGDAVLVRVDPHADGEVETYVDVDHVDLATFPDMAMIEQCMRAGGYDAQQLAQRSEISV